MKDDGYTRITLRIPNDLHARLSDRAARTSKSMNAEIIDRLEVSFAVDKRDGFQLLKVAMERLEKVRDTSVRLQTGIEKFIAGEKSALRWLATSPEAEDSQVLESAEAILNLLEDEFAQIRRFIPLLVDAAKGGQSVPDEIHQFLTEQ